MAIIKIKDFEGIRKKHKNEKIVFCSGTFDLLHAGHVLFLEDCKSYGDILVVGLGGNKVVKSYKNKNPIINEVMRLKMLDSLKIVDYVFLETARHLFDSLERVFLKLQPNFYVVNSDASLISERKNIADKYEVKFVVLGRKCPKSYENISTTNIIKKIKGL